MKHLMAALGVEVLKLKRTLALTLTATVPSVVAVLQLGIMLQRARYGIYEADDPWGVLAHNMLVIYNLLMLPLFITLQTALLAGLEHNAKSWKRLYALPIPRGAIYVAKQIVTLGLIGLSMAVLVALMPVVGAIRQALEPRFALTLDTIPWDRILPAAAAAYFLSWSLIALHTWIATRWPSFVVATATGIIATIAGAVAWSSDYGIYYPWTIPGVITHEVYYPEAGVQFASVAIGFLSAPLVALAACWDVTHRDALGAL
mgnify:CR=1 FL=1